MKKVFSLFVCVCLLFCVAAPVAYAEPAYGDGAPVNKPQYFSYGDVNKDGEVAVSDARTVLRVAVSLETLDSETALLADVDADGEVGVSDARKILRAAVTLEDPALFGLNGSEIFLSGHFSMGAYMNDTDDMYIVRAHTENTSYMEARVPIDLEGTGEPGDPVRIGFLTTTDGVYWVLPDADENGVYMLFNDEVSGQLGIGDEFFMELLPPGLSGNADNAEPDRKEKVTVDGKEMTRLTFNNEDGTAVALDLDGNKLVYVRTYDTDGVELAAMKVDYISPSVPTYQHSVPSQEQLVNMLAFMLKFAELANIDMSEMM